jgi:hypothetical protein
MNRNRSIGIARGYGLKDQGQNFSLLHNVQTDFGAHPTSYPVGEADHSTPSIAKVKNGGAKTPLPHTS